MSAVRLAQSRLPAKGEAEAREDERRRLARELHDGPAQSLAGALFGVDLALSALREGSGSARDELLAARGLVRDALDEIRALMAGLRPRQLEERGLVTALRGLAAMPPLWGTEVTIDISGMAAGDRLPPDIELGLYRIAQEAISNARRHGAASSVRVALDVETTRAALTITDNGRGWVDHPAMQGVGRGEGIPGMQERARLLEGELRIESAPNGGTKVSVAAPIAGGGANPGEVRG